MSMTKYGAQPEQTSKTASGAPGTHNGKVQETLKEKLEREAKNKEKTK